MLSKTVHRESLIKSISMQPQIGFKIFILVTIEHDICSRALNIVIFWRNNMKLILLTIALNSSVTLSNEACKIQLKGILLGIETSALIGVSKEKMKRTEKFLTIIHKKRKFIGDCEALTLARKFIGKESSQ